MRTLCEVSTIKEGTENDETPIMEKREYYLLHFGLQYQVIDCGEGKLAVGQWTVCYCEDKKTGQIKMFDPTRLRILGQIIK
jgi:hypothetical protein